MRREELYLQDILDASQSIQSFLKTESISNFTGNDLLQSAIIQKLLVIGEASAKLPVEFRERHPEIPWADMIGMRNMLVHSYFSVNLRIIWRTATHDVPQLEQQIKQIKEEF